MKRLVTADIHLNSNPRDEYRHTFMEKTLPELVHRHKPNELVILGDLTDEKDYHGARLVNRIVAHIHRLALIVPVCVLKGNHDYTDPDHPFFGFLSSVENVSWINKPLGTNGTFFLPHTHNYQRDWKGLNLQSAKLVFAHQTFEGAKGVGPHTEGIPRSVFGPGTTVISGDVHIPQNIGGAIIYAGAPYTIDFGDDYSPRVLLAHDHDRVDSIPVPGRQKRLIEINQIYDLDPEMANDGDIVKVRMDIETNDHALWPELQAKIRSFGAQHGWWMYDVRPRVIVVGGKATARRRTEVRTDEELVRIYGKARGIGEKTLKTGLELMRKGK